MEKFKGINRWKKVIINYNTVAMISEVKKKLSLITKQPNVNDYHWW